MKKIFFGCKPSKKQRRSQTPSDDKVEQVVPVAKPPASPLSSEHHIGDSGAICTISSMAISQTKNQPGAKCETTQSPCPEGYHVEMSLDGELGEQNIETSPVVFDNDSDEESDDDESLNEVLNHGAHRVDASSAVFFDESNSNDEKSRDGELSIDVDDQAPAVHVYNSTSNEEQGLNNSDLSAKSSWSSLASMSSQLRSDKVKFSETCEDSEDLDEADKWKIDFLQKASLKAKPLTKPRKLALLKASLQSRQPTPISTNNTEKSFDRFTDNFKLRKEIQEIEKRYLNVQETIWRYEFEIEHLKQKNRSLESLRPEVKTLLVEKENLSTKIQQLTVELENKTTESEEVRKNDEGLIDTLRADIKNDQVEIEIVQEKLSIAEKEIDALKLEFEEKIRQNDKLHEEIEELRLNIGSDQMILCFACKRPVVAGESTDESQTQDASRTVSFQCSECLKRVPSGRLEASTDDLSNDAKAESSDISPDGDTKVKRLEDEISKLRRKLETTETVTRRNLLQKDDIIRDQVINLQQYQKTFDEVKDFRSREVVYKRSIAKLNSRIQSLTTTKELWEEMSTMEDNGKDSKLAFMRELDNCQKERLETQSEYEREIEAVKKHCQEYERLNKELQLKIQESEDEKAAMQTEISNLKDVGVLGTEFDTLEYKLLENAEGTHVLQEEKKSVMKQLETLEKKYETETTSLKKDIAVLTEKYEKAKVENEKINTEKKTSEAQLNKKRPTGYAPAAGMNASTPGNVTTLKKKIIKLEKENKSVTLERDNATLKVLELETELGRMKGLRSRLSDLDSVQIEKNMLQDQLQRLREKGFYEIDQLRSEVETLNKKLLSADEAKKQVEAEKRDLEKSLGGDLVILRRNEELQTELNNISKKLESIQIEHSDLLRQNETLKMSLESGEEQNHTLSKKSLAKKDHWRNKVIELEKVIEELSQNVAKEISNKEVLEDDLKAKLEEKIEENERLKLRIEYGMKQLEKTNAEVKRRQEDIRKENRMKIDILESNETELKMKIEVLEDKLNEGKETLEFANNERVTFVEQINELDSELRLKVTLHAELEAQVVKLRQENGRLKKVVANKAKNSSEFDQIVETAMTTAQTLEAKVSTNHDKLSEAEMLLNEAHCEITNLKTAKDALKAEMLKFKESKIAEVSILISRIRDLKSQLEVTKIEKESALKEVTMLRDDLSAQSSETQSKSCVKSSNCSGDQTACEEITEVSDMNKTLTARLKVLSSEKDSLYQKIDQFVEHVQIGEKKRIALLIKIRRLSTDRKRLRVSLDTEIRQNMAHEADVAKLHSRIDTLLTQLQNKHKLSDDVRTVLEKELKGQDVSDERDILLSLNKRYKNDLKTALVELDRLRKCKKDTALVETSTITDRYENVVSTERDDEIDIKAVIEELRNTSDALEEERERSKLLMEERNRCHNEMNEIRQKMAELDAERAEHLHKTADTHERADNTVETLSTALKQSHSDLSTARNCLKEEAGKTVKNQKENSELYNELTRVKADFSNLQEELARAVEHSNNLDIAVKALTEEKFLLENLVTRLRSDHEVKKQERRRKVAEFQKLKEAYDKNVAEVHELKSLLVSEEQMKENLLTKISHLNSDLEHCRARLNSEEVLRKHGHGNNANMERLRNALSNTERDLENERLANKKNTEKLQSQLSESKRQRKLAESKLSELSMSDGDYNRVVKHCEELKEFNSKLSAKAENVWKLLKKESEVRENAEFRVRELEYQISSYRKDAVQALRGGPGSKPRHPVAPNLPRNATSATLRRTREPASDKHAKRLQERDTQSLTSMVKHKRPKMVIPKNMHPDEIPIKIPVKRKALLDEDRRPRRNWSDSSDISFVSAGSHVSDLSSVGSHFSNSTFIMDRN